MASSHVNTPINKSPAADEEGNPPQLSNTNESSAVADDSGSDVNEVVDAQPSGDDNYSISSNPGNRFESVVVGATNNQRRGSGCFNGDGEMDGGAEETKEKDENMRGNTVIGENEQERHAKSKEGESNTKLLVDLMREMFKEERAKNEERQEEMNEKLLGQVTEALDKQNAIQDLRQRHTENRIQELTQEVGNVKKDMSRMVSEQVRECFDQHMRNAERARLIEPRTEDVEARVEVHEERPVTRTEPPRLPVPVKEHTPGDSTTPEARARARELGLIEITDGDLLEAA